jgi:hypothetical protein
MDAFLWPHGKDAAGRTWEDHESALADVTIAMKRQGLSKVLVTRQEYWDPARTLLKKLVIKCPRARLHRGLKLEDVRVDHRRNTSTSKCGCPVHINLKVERSGKASRVHHGCIVPPHGVTGMHASFIAAPHTHTHTSAWHMRAHSLLLLVGEARVTTSETNHSHPLDVHADLGGSASDITPELQDLIRQWADHSIRRSEIIKLVSMHLRERVLSSVVKAKVMNVVHHT